MLSIVSWFWSPFFHRDFFSGFFFRVGFRTSFIDVWPRTWSYISLGWFLFFHWFRGGFFGCLTWFRKSRFCSSVCWSEIARVGTPWWLLLHDALGLRMHFFVVRRNPPSSLLFRGTPNISTTFTSVLVFLVSSFARRKMSILWSWFCSGDRTMIHKRERMIFYYRDLLRDELLDISEICLLDRITKW